jgi:hypothetical protein
MARLTVRVNDETVERLRTLAGGERKIGAMLDDVTTWLWSSYQDAGAAITVAELLGAATGLPQRIEDTEERITQVHTEIAQVRSQADALIDYMIAKMDLSSEDIETLRRLQAQEDSGNDDA